MSFIKQLFCAHDDFILSEHTMESQAEKLTRLGMKLTKVDWPALSSKFIIVYKCKKCNRIKESVHSNINT